MRERDAKVLTRRTAEKSGQGYRFVEGALQSWLVTAKSWMPAPSPHRRPDRR